MIKKSHYGIKLNEVKKKENEVQKWKEEWELKPFECLNKKLVRMEKSGQLGRNGKEKKLSILDLYPENDLSGRD